MGTPGATLHLEKTAALAQGSGTYNGLTWTTQIVNTGPSSWWSSGAGQDVVIPWAGPYLINLEVVWDENASGRRCVYLNRTTTISTSNFVAGSCRAGLSATESGTLAKLTGVFDLAADTYRVAGYQNSGTSLNLEGNFASPPAVATFTYLGV